MTRKDFADFVTTPFIVFVGRTLSFSINAERVAADQPKTAPKPVDAGSLLLEADENVFAAMLQHLIENATAKLKRKGCDWILANDVSPATGVMGGDRNTVHLLRRNGAEIGVDDWPIMTKDEVAVALIAQIAERLGTPT